KAVDTIDGPVMVIAGPGTGKTQVLTVRVANILEKTDTDPSAILALTFTESAAKEMRARLIDLIGKNGYYVRITTFHSFCNDIITENPERFSRPAGMVAATDLEKIEIITRILEEGSFLLLKPLNNPTLYLKDILASISDLKREGITVKKFAQLVRSISEEFDAEKASLKKTAFAEKEKLVSKNVDLLSIYKKYQDELTRLGRFDYEDMINWVIDAFDIDEEFLLTYQEKYQYILVDEYQDTNSAQNRLIFSLGAYWGKTANLFVVGDPHQSIFRFQGASQENTRQFEKNFPNVIKINLNENYRSTPVILSSAAALIADSPLKHNVNHMPPTIKIAKFSSSVFEDEFIIRSIQEKFKKGVSPSDIAVIVKENKDIDHLIDLFKQKGIPYRLEGGTNILTTPLISQFIKILHLITALPGPIDDLDLFIILNYPYFKLDPLEVLKLARQAHTQRISLIDVLHEHPLFNLFVSWVQAAATLTLPEIFQKIFYESGLMDYILKLPQPITELNRFGTLYEDAKKQLAANHLLGLTGYVKNLDLMQQHQVKIPEAVLVSEKASVTLTTAHKAKGLEWLIVYVYRFADTHWGNKTNRQMIKLPAGIISYDVSKEDKNADERRLFYVALTRAKKELFLCGASSYSHSAKMTFPAMFYSDLPKIHLEEIDTEKLEKNAPRILADLMSPAAPTIHDDEENYLQEIIASFKLSPTALNTYLECRYKFKLDNLYRIPRAKSPAMCFGTAVHFALENLYRKLNRAGKLESKKDFLTDFENALKWEVLSESELKDRLTHGRKILSSYYDHYQDEFAPALFTEKNFGYSTPVLLDDIPLSGKVDRIESLPASRQVHFIDYKTGAPKTRGVLEKDAEGPDGNYKRQLTFYHLLADLDKSFGHKVVETVLDFIEPDKKGIFHRERFNITPGEIKELKETIKKSVAEIRALNFGHMAQSHYSEKWLPTPQSNHPVA
ncbi:ATP-dependent helicase, partial [Candidatus Collierbacteria bacterium]|nr:ATP-dependent helicase [Candidatus Collierbacteria bacterium]